LKSERRMVNSVRSTLIVLVTLGVAMAVGSLVADGLDESFTSVSYLASGATGLFGFQVLTRWTRPRKED
jgi:hypothetical protein